MGATTPPGRALDRVASQARYVHRDQCFFRGHFVHAARVAARVTTITTFIGPLIKEARSIRYTASYLECVLRQILRIVLFYRFHRCRWNVVQPTFRPERSKRDE